MTERRVLVAGSANMDIVATTERHPRSGETVPGRELHFFPGGKGANQAIAAARLGACVVFVARLGKDAFAEPLEDFLKQRGVDLTWTLRTEAVSTGIALIVVDSAAENRIVVVPGANQCLSSADVSRVQIKAGDILVSQFEIPLSTIQSFFERGRAHGAFTLLNPAPAQPLPGNLLQLVDLLVLNEIELATLSGVRNLEVQNEQGLLQAAEAVRRDPRQVVVLTLGPSGVLCLDGTRVHRIAGRKVEAVDSTGAGDCFVGALAAELVRGSQLSEALGFANRAASLCVQAQGAGPSMPDRSAVERTGEVPGA